MTGVVMMSHFTQRISERFATSVACRVCTVLENLEATIVDISRHGAKVQVVNAFKTGDSIFVDIDGHIAYGEVTWAEFDRIGVKFLMPIQNGRFADVLSDARRRHEGVQPRVVGSARPTFGRRAA